MQCDLGLHSKKTMDQCVNLVILDVFSSLSMNIIVLAKIKYFWYTPKILVKYTQVVIQGDNHLSYFTYRFTMNTKFVTCRIPGDTNYKPVRKIRNSGEPPFSVVQGLGLTKQEQHATT